MIDFTISTMTYNFRDGQVDSIPVTINGDAEGDYASFACTIHQSDLDGDMTLNKLYPDLAKEIAKKRLIKRVVGDDATPKTEETVTKEA